MHRAAALALQDALRGSSTELLQSAFERAQSIGVQGSLFEKARNELAKRTQRQDAEDALYAALHGSHGTRSSKLADALDQAAAAGVSVDLISHARRRLTEVEAFSCSREASSVAEQNLQSLVSTCDDVKALSSALDAAQEAGASLKVIDTARKKKAELEEQAWEAQTRDLADRKPAKDEAVSTGSCTPASTIGIVGDVREELFKLMRMPTRPLEDTDEQPSSPIQQPAPTEQYGGTACMNTLQVPPSMSSLNTSELINILQRDPASEPRCAAVPDISFEQTPARMQEMSNTLTGVTPIELVMEEQPAPAPRSSWRPSVEGPMYGLDAELKAKAEANYDATAEFEAAQWVQDITGVQVIGEFGEALRTGQVLCQLVNCIQPGTIAKINNAGMPFKERENISKFLKACRTWGVHEYALFSTDDLYDEKNLLSVVKCIHQLGGVLQRSVPDFQGPHLGVADTSNAKRDQKRALEQASQTGGLHVAMSRSHVDVVSTGNVRAPTRGGC